MFNSARNRFRNQFIKVLDIPDLHDKIIVANMTIGLVSGSLYGAVDSRRFADTPLQETITNTISGGCFGTICGGLVGLMFPILAPACIVSSVIGLGAYGYSAAFPKAAPKAAPKGNDTDNIQEHIEDFLE